MWSRTARLLGIAAIVTAVALGASAAAFAQDGPPIPKEVNIIKGEQIKKMLDGKEKFFLVDTRNPAEYKEGHLPTAVSVYDKDMEANRAKFPADKAMPLVFYCNGYPKCIRSLNGAKIALGWGYTKVHLYKEGIPEWEAKGFPVAR
jgi:rhodanese-related sulfurtransferase